MTGMNPFRFLFLAAAALAAPCVCALEVSRVPDYQPPHPEVITRNILLPPGPGNPRNSEGDFILLRDGRLMFVYTHFSGGGGDHDRAFLAARYSPDGGKTWTASDEVIVPADESGWNVMSVSFVRLPLGEIGMIYLRKNSDRDCRPVIRRSQDEGKTWSEPREMITDEVGYYVLNNDRVEVLKSGRLVAPVSLHKDASGKFMSRGRALCYLSDDFGRTWRRSRTVLDLSEHPDDPYGLQEPGIIQRKDGSLLMFCRTGMGVQYLSTSEDGGETWTPVRPSDIRSPCSPASMARIPKTGDLMMVWNDRFNPAEGWSRGHRTPFNVAISRDEGRTWIQKKVLENDPDGWYCYTAIGFVDGRVVLGHCAGDRLTNGLATTQITSFPISWLYE